MKHKEPKYFWNEETGQTVCQIFDNKGNVYIGEAICHPDDKEFQSKRVGQEIAYRRALIDFYKKIRKEELRPKLAAYKELYNEMCLSPRFNQNSYENYSLQRKIRKITFDLEIVNNMIARERIELIGYIDEKEKIHQKLQKLRKDKAN